MLQGTAAIGTTLWLGGESQSRADDSPNEKINIACIGIGGRGGANVGGCSGQNIVALCDVDERRGARTDTSGGRDHTGATGTSVSLRRGARRMPKAPPVSIENHHFLQLHESA